MRWLLCLCLLGDACVGQESENYVFGFLRTHPERATLPEAEAAAIQKAHLAHIDKMARDGYLVGAGPLSQSPDLRGVLIFRGITIDRAREIASQDPAVINKRLRVHVEEWKAVKGIGEGIAKNMKDPNFKFKMTRYGFVVSHVTQQTPQDWDSSEVRKNWKSMPGGWRQTGRRWQRSGHSPIPRNFSVWPSFAPLTSRRSGNFLRSTRS
jgi:uncharacterized protein YciI